MDDPRLDQSAQGPRGWSPAALHALAPGQAQRSGILDIPQVYSAPRPRCGREMWRCAMAKFKRIEQECFHADEKASPRLPL